MKNKIDNMEKPQHNEKMPVSGSDIMKDVNELRETLDMIEWCLDGKSKNIALYIDDLPKNVNSVLRHFR